MLESGSLTFWLFLKEVKHQQHIRFKSLPLMLRVGATAALSQRDTSPSVRLILPEKCRHRTLPLGEPRALTRSSV